MATLASRQYGPAGLWPPKMNVKLVTHMTHGPWMVTATDYAVGQREICPLEVFRVCNAADAARSISKKATGTFLTMNGLEVADIFPYVDLNSINYSVPIFGNKPVGFAELSTIYKRYQVNRLRGSITLIKSARDTTLQQATGGDAQDYNLDVAAHPISFSSAAAINKQRYCWVGVTLLPQHQTVSYTTGAGRDKVGELPPTVEDALTTENTWVKMVNFDHQTSSVSIDVDIDIAKWLGASLTDEQNGMDTRYINPTTGLENPNPTIEQLKPPVKQLFLVVWVAPLVRTNSKLWLTDEAHVEPNLPRALPTNIFDAYISIHSKFEWDAKFYEQNNVNLQTASATWGGA